MIQQATRNTIHVEASPSGGAVSIDDPSGLEILALAMLLGAALVGAALWIRAKRDARELAALARPEAADPLRSFAMKPGEYADGEKL